MAEELYLIQQFPLITPRKALNSRRGDGETLKNIHVNTQGQIAPLSSIKTPPHSRIVIIHKTLTLCWQGIDTFQEN